MRHNVTMENNCKKENFNTYDELYSLLKRYIRYCYDEVSNEFDYDETPEEMTDSFMTRFNSKHDIEEWFRKHFINSDEMKLNPTSYYDLEIKLTLRGY